MSFLESLGELEKVMMMKKTVIKDLEVTSICKDWVC